ncbi:MAG: bifunctional adenosylcobinamide kinase/adenosylcobinamide-phosphate guanylyltransferase [Oscillospiraceae bacterium]|nr:bifunctional adenosylcobinamide kinase/adenosylcobinamide-phosphate guanylyltransferase [Oscillospiraceae bacterium]
MKILLTGGSGCGKSSYAEKLVMKFPLPRWYVATMRSYGAESEAKIARHRAMRSTKGFETIESQTDVGAIDLSQGGTVLLECLCNLTANEMFDDEGNERDPYEKILRDVRRLASQADNLILVTNDVGSDGEAYSDSTLRYVDTLGRLNRAFAAEFDTVYELVCGIPLLVKGEEV